MPNGSTHSASVLRRAVDEDARPIRRFGIAALRERTLSHVLGGSLLLLGVAWFLLFGATFLNGFPVAHRVVLATGVLQTPALFGTGYALHLDPGAADRPRILVDHSTED